MSCQKILTSLSFFGYLDIRIYPPPSTSKLTPKKPTEIRVNLHFSFDYLNLWGFNFGLSEVTSLRIKNTDD